MIKHQLLGALFFISMSSNIYATSPALFYPDELSVQSGRGVLGTLANDVVIINSRDTVLVSSGAFLGPLGGVLHEGILNRFDADLGVMLYKMGPIVSDVRLQSSFNSQADKLVPFFSEEVKSHLPSSLSLDNKSVQPFSVMINEQNPELGSVKLDVKRKRSKCELVLVRVSTVPVWSVSVKIESTPKMSFWKGQRAQNLTDVPRPVFRYDYQVMFNPLKNNGKSVTIPLELFFIEDREYVWHLSITTKVDKSEFRIPIVFNNPS